MRYAHIQEAFVNVCDSVKTGDKITLSGVTGNASRTRAPHLHFKITNHPRAPRGLNYRCNPSFYVNLIDEANANKTLQSKVSESKHIL